jgi:hypothetical protein
VPGYAWNPPLHDSNGGAVMKFRLRAPNPALVISLIALFVALGGTTAYASGLISGTQIVDHSIPAKKLTAAALNALHGQRGPAGPGAYEVYSANDLLATARPQILARTSGVTVSYLCDGDHDRIRFYLNRSHQPGHTVFINGFYAQDGVVKSATEQGIGHDGIGGGTLNLSVTAGVLGQGVSHIDLSGTSRDPVGVDASCTVSGLITPSVPPSYRKH